MNTAQTVNTARVRPVLVWILAALFLKPSFQISSVTISEFPFKLPVKMVPGDVLLVDVSKAPPGTFEKLAMHRRPLTLWKKNIFMASVGVPNLIDRSTKGHPAPLPLVALVGEGPLQKGHAFRSPHQTIYIHEIRVDLRTPDQAIKLRLPAAVLERLKRDEKHTEDESRLMKEIVRNETREWNLSCWKRPIRSTEVSDFASPRTLPDGRAYYHTGLDIRAGVGNSVYASADGVVAFAGFMTIPGNVIVVDHGGGIFSRYMHLSKVIVNQGDPVKRGEELALSGATGRVEAPHLHWEVVWKGIPVDPRRFLQAVEPTCDPG